MLIRGKAIHFILIFNQRATNVLIYSTYLYHVKRTLTMYSPFFD